MNKLLALAVAAATAASADAFAAESTCTAAPSCSELGYTQSASVCSGQYIKCPFDTTKVMCVNGGPHIGDLKYSLYAYNHDGWLLCDGTQYSQTTYAKLHNLLGTKFCHRYTSKTDTSYSSSNCDSGKFAVPDYRGFFLRGLSTYNSYTNTVSKAACTPTTSRPASCSYYVSEAFYHKSGTYSTSIYYPQYEQLPNIRGEGPSLDDYSRDWVSIGGAFYEAAGSAFDAQSSHTNNQTKLNFDASRSNSIYGGSHVIPANYAAYIFIYAGE